MKKLEKQQENIVKLMDEENKKCIKCLKDYEKINMILDRSLCSKFCDTGIRVHKLELMLKNAWGTIDWNLSKYEEFYNH
ncbi:MAG: hypothetical protein RSB67_01285 [Clostridia bacterium]